ncbi:MAG: hypothetical protein DWB59_10515 [Anaerolineae bacterium]|nr:hypothetical protein [Anaerolineae bacterium]
MRSPTFETATGACDRPIKITPESAGTRGRLKIAYYGKQDSFAPTVMRVTVQTPFASRPCALTACPTFKSAKVIGVGTAVALVL